MAEDAAGAGAGAVALRCAGLEYEFQKVFVLAIRRNFRVRLHAGKLSRAVPGACGRGWHARRMRKLYVIGIGAGDPRQVTMQAIEAMRQVEVFFVIGKGEAKRELVEVRTEILRAHLDTEPRIVEIADPPRDRAPDHYGDVVRDWHERRAELLARAFAEVDGVGGILVWGDPSLYDSTLRMIERVLRRGTLGFDYEVIPGVTSAQALA